MELVMIAQHFVKLWRIEDVLDHGRCGVCWVKERIATWCQYIIVRGWECWLAAWLVQTPEQQQSSCTVCDSETTDHWTLQWDVTPSAGGGAQRGHPQWELRSSPGLNINIFVSTRSWHDDGESVLVTGAGCGESQFPNGSIAQWGGGWRRRVKCLVTLTVLVCC